MAYHNRGMPKKAKKPKKRMASAPRRAARSGRTGY